MLNLIKFNKKYLYYQIIPTLNTDLDANKLDKLFNIFNKTLSRTFEIKYMAINNKLNIFIKINERDKALIKILKNQIGGLVIKRIKTRNVKQKIKYIKLRKHYSNPIIITKNNQETSSYLLDQLLNNPESSINFSIKPNNSIRNNLNRRSLINGNAFQFNLFNPLESIKYFFYIIFRIIFLFFKVLDSLISKNNYKKSHEYIIDSHKSVLKLDKLFSPLFKMQIRINYVGKNDMKIFKNWINMINQNNYQKMYLSNMRYVNGNNIYSSIEIASLLAVRKKEIIHKFNQINVVPITNRDNTSKDINIGLDNYSLNSYGLTKNDRQKHMLILGATGSGKTTLLKNLILQDINNGEGLTLIDPHGDLASEIIKLSPKVINFNPSTSVIKINLLERKYLKSDPRSKLEEEYITENVVSVLSKLFSSEDKIGSRIEYLLRNLTQSILYLDQPTIYKMYQFLIDEKFRKSVINKITDTLLKSYWIEEFGKSGDYQRIKIISGLTSKLGRLVISKTYRNMFHTYKSNIDFDEIIRNKQILICNMSKGLIGESNSRLIGDLVIAKIQLAALATSNVEMNQRTAHHIYIDEFQNYHSPSFSQLLSEARKYKIDLTLAQQSLANRSLEELNSTLANISNFAIFRLQSKRDIELVGNLYTGFIKNDAFSKLPNYHFYFRSMDNVGPKIASLSTT